MFKKLVFAFVLSSMFGALTGCGTSEYAKSDYKRKKTSQNSGHSHH